MLRYTYIACLIIIFLCVVHVWVFQVSPSLRLHSPKIWTRNHTPPPAYALCVLRISSAFEVASSIWRSAQFMEISTIEFYTAFRYFSSLDSNIILNILCYTP